MDTVVFRETTVHFYSCMRYKLMHTGRDGRKETAVVLAIRGASGFTASFPWRLELL